MGPSSPAGGAACLPPHMTEVGAKARGTVGWDRSVTKCYAPRLFLMGRRTPFKRHLFSIGLSAVVEKVGKQKVLHVSRATREVLRAGRKAPWRLLASTATLPGWSAMVRSTVRHRRGLRRLGGVPHVHVAAASHTAHLREGHPHTAPPPQMPTSYFLPAWSRAAQLSSSIFPNSWLPPQLPPGPSVEPDGPVLSPRGSGDPVCLPAAASVPFTLSLLRVFIQQRFGRGEPSALHLLKRCHCAWGPGPSWAMESWAGDPCVHLSFCIQPAASSPACGEMCESGGGVGPRVLWVQLRREASLWAPPLQLTVWLPEDGWK